MYQSFKIYMYLKRNIHKTKICKYLKYNSMDIEIYNNETVSFKYFYLSKDIN